MRWSPEAVARARAGGRPVLVDFTAKNCLNCQVNKRTSLEISETRAKLKAINALALLGDFSNADPLIAAELRRYNRPGVPLVLVYPRDADRPPIVLPEILTPSLVLEALSEAAK
jgi:thiol:disulfide interchange protein DsbD